MTLTPEQFNKIALKKDLEKYATKDDLVEMKTEILTVLDGIAKKLDNMSQEATSNIVAHDRMNEKIDEHDVKINKLELAVS
ncbi:MAG: hypothetical protein UT48_C0015G0014 [Parcubacteria group bacterium GW2011_GWE2_39_37]|uniref:Uncharacterized protein n=1 Tax=Candidatus Falkowbacteria bacterium GW2011_GWF2_39_8 TaxID=1618642 RepID=A0A0G0T719_9BACT|nr:MAG: hypothetical protein UT48_C0015G0014 [Parcubacteria group bacterium GW2011_GWE2_39_37]KKR33622.1 MAG: hypothetical protein UT64_C0005G0002 [Candidatus Falkowbacteria bacterium GW2011_GWF2_39_8]